MSAIELKKAYFDLPDKERFLFASFVAAERVAGDPEFAFQLGRRHERMDAGKKWSHTDMLELHDRLDQQGL